MPDNEKRPHPFDYSPNLKDGRTDVQGVCHFFLDSLFTGCTILDVGAGLGQSKTRLRHNRVTTYDIDPRLHPFVDVAGPEMPEGPFDIVSAFDVLEHVEDDRGFLRQVCARATRAVFVTTPNWRVSKCQSDHHWREYTGAELIDLVTEELWERKELFLFGHFKDRWGSWFDLIQEEDWGRHMGTKHALLILHHPEDRYRIGQFFKDRWGKASQPVDRWVPQYVESDAPPAPLAIAEDEPEPEPEEVPREGTHQEWCVDPLCGTGCKEVIKT